MKNRIFIGLLTMMMFFACSKNDDLIKSKVEKFTLSNEMIDQIGVEHNKALSFVFEGLKRNQKELNLGKELKSLINNELYVFYKEVSYFRGASKIAIEMTQHQLKSVLFEDAQTYSKSNDLNFQDLISTYSNNLSEAQKDLLLELERILNDNNEDLEKILLKLDILEERTKLELASFEAQLILIGIQVAKNSSCYWHENLNDWIEILSVTDVNHKNWFSWGDVIKGDVLGAIGGATSALFANLVPGVGQVAYGSAILGGAVVGSVVAAADQIYDHL